MAAAMAMAAGTGTGTVAMGAEEGGAGAVIDVDTLHRMMVEDLAAELESQRRKFEAWCEASEAAAQDAERQALALSEESRKVVEELSAAEVRAVAEGDRLAAERGAQGQELERLEEQLRALRTDEAALPPAVEGLRAALREREAEVDEARGEVSGREAERERKEAVLDEVHALFAQCLGLRFRHGATTGASGGRNALSLCFTQIDARDAGREFVLTLHVAEEDEGGGYSLGGCSPPLPGLDAMVAELNASDDRLAFRYFVQRVRKQFQRACGAAAPLAT